MNGQKELYEIFKNLDINFEYYEHPEAPTIEIAKKYWENLEATHCKNIFLRNHKGNKHYLVIFEHTKELSIKSLEQSLKQGKLSFASDWRLKEYLNLKAGSVSPFGLINDTENHVTVFIDKNLLNSDSISFHPNINTASLIIKKDDFVKFMNWTKNYYEFLELY
ncbi:MAG: prolyl-tRNA synthetase associated domain-containing protein [Bacteroidales bacterium]|nr:prolyl-tRNA synthetase associated domain-containing protein [Bacteroidales bacterium]MBN2757744.1 prolyl-tRNA synthetase associated domain-containing protein [Bacteroidales bacterium]